MSERAGDFSINRWCAWAPGVTDGPDWRDWIAGKRSDVGEQPNVSFLPALLRRRLDRVGRMALHVAWHCAEGHTALPLVFASRHGSIARTVQLLDDLARNEPLSPAIFSLSVHNSIAGLFSMARGDRSPATALAAGRRTLVFALLEGAGMLEEGAGKVLVVYADEMPPPEYRAYLEQPEPDFAVGLLLTIPDGRRPAYRLVRGHTAASGPRPEVALMDFLLQDAPVADLDGDNHGWQLLRLGGHA
ncbi:MAG: beta-ketoacyl synthase chain length factor [Gammaproteobacteria bacterium]